MSTITELEQKLNELGNGVGQLQGEYKFMQKEYDGVVKLIEESDTSIKLHEEAVELLTLVQHVTRDRIKETFESLITWSLRYVFKKDYSFCLEFGKRGNLQELDFCIKSDGNEEPALMTDSRGGGICDVVSLSLRLVIMELLKIKGFLICDESLEKVKGEENIARLNSFVEELSTRFKRQIINITDSPVFKDNQNYNLIELS